ncbi:MAG TPA: hypothetical protein VFL65_00720 [Jatrophihabitans sp.]|nr:hypothetical protein [Jatrophihabitans sp.]
MTATHRAAPIAWLADWECDLLGLPRSNETPKVGDRVQVTVTGYVEHVYADGSVDVVDKRAAFPNIEDVRDLGCYEPDEHTAIRVVERAPKAPKVGDHITGADVKATPWRRGTIIRCADFPGSTYVSALVLLGDGTWRRINDGRGPVTFAELRDAATFRVEHAPGK